MVERKRNGKISFWKFVFSLLIVAYHVGNYHHTSFFGGGYLGVEFFFIVSGYYLCKKGLNYKRISDKSIGKETFQWIISRIKKLLPYVVILWLIGLPISIWIDKMSLYDFTTAIANSLYIPNSGNQLFALYGITWFIVALLIGEAIMFPILLKYKENYSSIWSFIITFFLFSYIMIQYGNINDPWIYGNISYKGIIRALLDLNIGICIYTFLDYYKKIKLTDFSKFCLTCLELIGYGSIIYLSTLEAHRFDFIALILIILCLSISFSHKGYLMDFSNNKVFYYMEKLSIPIFINQYIFIKLLAFIMKSCQINLSIYLEIVINIVISILFAILEVKLIKEYQKNRKKVLSILIEE